MASPKCREYSQGAVDSVSTVIGAVESVDKADCCRLCALVSPLSRSLKIPAMNLLKYLWMNELCV